MTALDPRALEAALRAIVATTHQPNPQDRRRIDVAPGKHRDFQYAIHHARALLATLPAASAGSVGEAMPSREWLQEKIASDPDLENDAAVLAPPVQEPVAWRWRDSNDEPWQDVHAWWSASRIEAMRAKHRYVQPLYASPSPLPTQEDGPVRPLNPPTHKPVG